MFHKEEIEKLSYARYKRKMSQYNITKQTVKSIAEKIKKMLRILSINVKK